MNHPNREVWMSFLYDELESTEREACAAHLATCPQCKRQVDDWTSTRATLAAYVVPPKVVAAAAPSLPWRWAAAAAILLLTSGFAVGRFAFPGIDTAALKAELRQELAAQFQDDVRTSVADTLASARGAAREQLAAFARYYEQTRLDDQQAVFQTAAQIEGRCAADNAALRKDLETVAVLTEVGFRQTKQQLVSFVDSRSPQSMPSTSP